MWEVCLSTGVSGDDRSASRKRRRDYESCREVRGYGQADGAACSQAGASQMHAKRRRDWAQCERCLEKLAIEVLTALGQ
jgi:hypothetical protein